MITTNYDDDEQSKHDEKVSIELELELVFVVVVRLQHVDGPTTIMLPMRIVSVRMLENTLLNRMLKL